ncbi:MAG: FAD:protein FMN transferase [Flavobacteriales bacterium]|nr:FAD:protein FMN transferase [Flavobacteriales bacterium]
MKKILFVGITAILISCQTPAVKESVSEVIVQGEAQGTTYTIKYIAEEYNGIKEEVDSLLQAVDQSMSTYLPSSDISRLNEGDTIEMDQLFQEVYIMSQKVNLATEGAFDPTIGPLIKAWGFDYANPQKMDSLLVRELLANSGFAQFEQLEHKLWRKNDQARINFNAVAQGYSVDIMAQLLDQKGIQQYYVELGGELKVKGKNKYGDWWIIGIDQPEGENLERKLAQRVSLKNSAMATSGNYRKFYEIDGKRYSHTLNPKTGYPAENNLLSATVITSDCGMADALATSFMVMGGEKSIAYLKQHPEIKAHLILAKEDGTYESFTTENMKANLLED